MRSTPTRHVLCLVALAAYSGLAQAQELTLKALTPTTVNAGGSVDFVAEFSKYQLSQGSGFAEAEPLPALGDQTWLKSSDQSDDETLQQVSISIRLNGNEVASLFDTPVSAHGGSFYTASLPVTLTFASAGSFTVAATAQWLSVTTSDSTTVTGTRHCNSDGGTGFICSNWSEIALGGSSLSLASGDLGPTTLTVAVVPEPQAWALWLGGLGLLGAGALRRRRS
jgi:MYXO-CTERM domain-containing protein